MQIITKDLLYINCLGKREPRIYIDDTTNSYHLTGYKKVFLVSKTGAGKYVIDREDTYSRYRAREVELFPGDVVKEFNSMIQAAKYMIENVLNLD